MKTIIAGSREGFSLHQVEEAIGESGFEITEVVCGDARGVDKLGEIWAEGNDIPVVHFEAKWKDLNVPGAIIKGIGVNKYNAKAGIDRNEKMAQYADALIAIWDGESSGTGNMILNGHRYGLRVFVKVIKK